MTKKFHELEIISRINRDGSGVTTFTPTELDEWSKNPLLNNEKYVLVRLSITHDTYIAFNMTAFVVKLKTSNKKTT